MITNKNDQTGTKFLDMQAVVGVTKHIGGFEATQELLSLCHIENAQQVLNVGCGIGVGSTYIAKKYDCHVVGVDISEKMLEWSHQRAREEKVEDKVEFHIDNVMGLTFEADRFDVVFWYGVDPHSGSGNSIGLPCASTPSTSSPSRKCRQTPESSFLENRPRSVMRWNVPSAGFTRINPASCRTATPRP